MAKVIQFSDAMASLPITGSGAKLRSFLPNPFQMLVSSRVGKTSTDVIEFAQKHNCGIELGDFMKAENIDTCFLDNLVQLKRAFSGFKNKLTVHAFFKSLDAGSEDPLIQKATRARFGRSLQLADALKADTVVFHTGYNAGLKSPAYERVTLSRLIDFWKEYIKEFERLKITAVLENVQENSPYFVLDVLEGVNSPRLKACLDTGHAVLNSSMPVKDWIREYKTCLHHIHLHNNFGQTDEHNAITNGIIKLEDVFNTLVRLNLKPNIVFESFTKNEATESINAMKKLIS